jgi:hypothetical protein
MGPGLLELSDMKLLNVPLGLSFNFHEVKLVDGISRLVLPGAKHSSNRRKRRRRSVRAQHRAADRNGTEKSNTSGQRSAVLAIGGR